MTNRLAAESSPYLKQHADNPVDWQPWDDDALALARANDKPILLSIGYSACHWCHVMAHESFEDAATARVMNDLFVCIKVDREERPDLDKIYQLAHQALTQRGGGWPLTVFLTPDDHLPFYAGTYFPKEPRYGMPPFVHVLQQIRAFWDTRRDDVRKQNAALNEFLQDRDTAPASTQALSHAPIELAIARIDSGFDLHYGGHRGAPKFPHCPELELLSDLGAKPEIVRLSLTRMAEGGIHDQIGGGFCRYSVDERWEIPHFEKMLYDNAQLLPLYANAANVPLFGHAANDVIEWLKREMTAPSGGFFSALDADSEHEEGKFYVWQRDEVRALLADDEFEIAERAYGFDRPPNFEQHAWNPIIAMPLVDLAQSVGVTLNEAERRLARARDKLFAARSKRIRPGLDDKILTAWNALMIAGLARAERVQRGESLLPLIDRALDCLYIAAWRETRLFASAGQSAKLPAYLDDHAFLLDALLETLQVRWNPRDLTWAIALADALIERFEDRINGGFFFTANDHEKLIQRPKTWPDDAVPSGNGVAARALLKLGHLLGETRYLDAAERTLRAAWPALLQTPQACPTSLRALNDFLNPRAHLVVRFGNTEEGHAWREAARNPHRRFDAYFIPESPGDLPGTLAAQKYTSGGVAYVCRGTNCLPPIEHADALAQTLG